MVSDFNTPIDGDMTSSTDMNSELRDHFRTAGKWGRFIAIVGLAMTGLMLVTMLFTGGAMFSMMADTPGFGGGAGAFGGAMMIFYLAIFLFSAYIYYLLYKFSVDAIKAADRDDMVTAASAMKSLGTLFKIVGVITAIYVGFMALMMVFGVLGGLAAAF